MTDARENAANPKQVREKGKKEDRESKQRHEDLIALLELPAGRRIFTWLIFEECHLNETSFHASGQQFAANEGRRGVAVQLMAEIQNADVEAWIRLLRERANTPAV